MKYSKKEIGKALHKQLNQGYNIAKLSTWASELFFDMRDDRLPELDNILHTVLMMDAGPEFEYSEQELRLLADMLINNEEDPIKRIDEMKLKGNTKIRITNENLRWLFEWYHNQRDGSWEHGIQIETLDKSGISLLIDLNQTAIRDRRFDSIDINRSAKDWIYCLIEDKIFKGFGGPFNLPEILEIFRGWIENDDLQRYYE